MITLGLNGIIAYIVAFCIYTTGVYFYGTHHQATVDNVKALKLANQYLQADNNLLNFNNMKLQSENTITSSVVMQDESQLADLQVKYTNSLVRNQKYETALNNSNRINYFWLLSAEGFPATGTMPGVSLRASGINGISQYIVPSDAASRIDGQLNDCRKDRLNFIALQKWTDQTATNYNGRTK